MRLKGIKIISLVLLAGLGAGCAPQPVFTPTPTKTPDSLYSQIGSTAQAATATPLPSLTPTNLPTDTPTFTETPVDPTATATETEVTSIPSATNPPPTRRSDLPAEHYWLGRPIGAGGRDYLDRTYAYGSTAGGKYRPHTGGDFFNALGVPVIAAGNGVIYYAGTDDTVLFGPEPNFYGNVIVIQMTDFTYNGRPVYTLYGHLSVIDVTAGQTVQAGEKIGEVGGTGIANGGTHLHFEVRIGDPNNYAQSTRNPDLWIAPYYGYGTLAGRITDSTGALLRNVSLTIEGTDATRYTWTYAGDENHPDDAWGENFTYGDLPEGWYTVVTRSPSHIYREDVYIEAGHTTWLELVFP